ncbi:hypothetical protein M9H77_20551 [Catharanthus roseus]|uniref:Uncharacterized protein n=1 Tax=Catharanthus roseus TaxID=4058 RepID=A0ACC0AJW6_CATRO|nr:hypothetical protein M9H77_20551 [Catharanthus roseus]
MLIIDERDRGLLKSRSRYITVIGWTLTDPEELFDVATDPRSRLSLSDRAACYIQYLFGSSLFTDKSGNIIPAKLWPLVKNAWIYMYFSMFVLSVRPGAQSCKSYI